jgi:hypothetical protein
MNADEESVPSAFIRVHRRPIIFWCMLFRMKPDFYTKAVLTLIAFLLAVIALKPLLGPDTIASAQRSFNTARTASGPISVLLSAYRKR